MLLNLGDQMRSKCEQKSSEEVEPDTDGEDGNERRGWNDRYGIKIRCAEISGTRVGNESLNPIAEVNTRRGCLRTQIR